jgi:hypothetical protein
MKKPKVKSLIQKRVQHTLDSFSETAIWELSASVVGSTHMYKYRLAYVVRSTCVLRYDNEAKKGGHRHYGDTQTPYLFSSVH